MRDLYVRYKSIILYIVFGIGTSIVNFASYWLFADYLFLGTIVSTVLAWLFSVLFAFVTNKLFVFESKSFELKALVKEVFSFFSCRFLTGMLDVVIMVIGVDILGIYDMFVKIVSSILVTILNYVASKLVVFRKSSLGGRNEDKT